MTMKAAVIGCGRIAYSFDDDPKRKMHATHIGAYQHTPGVSLAAICDVDGKKVEEVCRRKGIKGGYTDYKDMLGREKVDIVSVCTPPQTHKDIVLHIAKEKLASAIFCEKPVSDSLADAVEMITACRRQNVLLQINHQRRFDQLHLAVRAGIHAGTWGRVQQVNFHYCSGISNSGSHMFDLLRFFFGDVQWVQAYSSNNPSRNPADPNLDGMMCFKSGLIATFQAHDNVPYYIFDLDIYFEKARVVIKDAGFDAEFYALSDSRFFSNSKSFRKTAAPFPVRYRRCYMVRGVREIMACLSERRDSISSGEEGLRSMELIELSIKSASSGGQREFVVSPDR